MTSSFRVSVVAVLVASSLAVITYETPAVAAPAPVCAAEQPTAADAGRVAAACRKPVEILAERTEVSQTFANGDGSRTLEVSVEPERVRKGSAWVPVDTRLTRTRAGLAPIASALPVTFSAGGTGPFARLRDGSREIAVTWPGKLPAPVIETDSAVYRNVLPDVDLRVTAQPQGFSQVLVVRTRKAATSRKLASLTFGLKTTGVAVTSDRAGGLTARDSRGNSTFSSPAPLMWDSGTAAAANRSVMKVAAKAGTMTLVPDRRMLADPSARLPIHIDPSWTGNISSSAWTTVWSKHKSSSFWRNADALTNGKTYGSAGAGRTADCNGCADHIVRSFFRMDTSKVRGKQITKAHFRIEQKHSWTCNPKSNAKLWLTGNISAKTTWNNQPTWDGRMTAQTAANRKNGSVHGCSGVGTVEFDVRSMVAKAAAGKWSTMTVGLRAGDEGTKNQWKRFNHATPKLAITYNSNPGAITDRKTDNKACATGSARPYVYTATPIMAVKHSDPDTDQQNLTTYFYWWRLGGSRSESNRVSKASGNPSPVTMAIPSSAQLADGGTYVWQARTYDGSAYGPWSGTCEFTIDATPPPSPKGSTSESYPAGTVPSGGVGVEGTVLVTAPDLRPHEVKEYAWTLDSGVLTSATNVKADPTAGYGAEIRLKPLHDGPNVLRIWTRDFSGRYSTAALTHTFTVRGGQGPAAEWTFDEASGDPADISTHGNTATLNSPATRVAGRGGAGSALNPNVTGSATRSGALTQPHPDTGAPLAVRTDSTYTVTARARVDALGGTGKPTVVAATGTRTSAFTLSYSREENRWRFTVAGSDIDNPALYSALSTAAPQAGRWTHLTGVYNAANKTVALYVDGVAQGAAVSAPAVFNGQTALLIGKRRWNGADLDVFNGAIDDVRVYSFAETPARIGDLAAPLPAAVTFPNGAEVPRGTPLSVAFGAGGDVNVTRYRYSLDAPALDREATPSAAGGAVTVPVELGSAIGDRILYAAAVDGRGRVGPARQFPFTVTSSTTVTGTVLDGTTFSPVDRAVVTMQPGGRTVTTGDDGGYRFADFPAGTYTLSATKGGRCGLVGSSPVEVTGDPLAFDLYVFPYTDDLGYTCREATAALSEPAGPLALTGDDAIAEVELPFEFPFYGQAYGTAWVDTNGLLSLTEPDGSQPERESPNAVVAPFWDDLVVDAASSVRTAVTGSGPDERFTVQWQNVRRKESGDQRLSFEATLAPTGTVTFGYDGLDGDAERGAEARVGIEAADGLDGLAFSVDQPVLENGKAIEFVKPAAVDDLSLFDLAGRVLDAANAPRAGVTVTLDPGGATTQTGTDGVWRFEDLVQDSYAVSASTGGRCAHTAREQVELSADSAIDLRLAADHGTLGYACSVGAAAFADTPVVVPLTGDDELAEVNAPFAVPFHGRTWNSLWISTNGFIEFGARPEWNNGWPSVLPTGQRESPSVMPFWEELVVDGQASVRTGVSGTAPNRVFTVEWRDVRFWSPSTPDRLSFQVQFGENGTTSFHYGALDSAVTRGDGAGVGLQSLSGQVAFQYSRWEEALTSNSSITFTPGTGGSVEGTVTAAVTGETLAGVPVTLQPSGRSTVTASDGTYRFTGVPIGEHTVAASTTDTTCAGQSATETLDHSTRTSSTDVSLMTRGDEAGYTCATVTPTTFVPGGTVLDFSDPESPSVSVSSPFPVRMYGQNYTSMWVGRKGLVTFGDSWGDPPGETPLPSPEEETPNNSVYALWDDWEVDAAASIRTAASGTAPNRLWRVTWQNVYLADHPQVRASFQVTFAENGVITLAYADITATDPLENGSRATVGIENRNGTIAYQYLHKQALLAAGKGVVFRPGTAGSGSVTGTVVCSGAAVTGATVRVAGLSGTTNDEGVYLIESVPAGDYAVIATVPGGDCRRSEVSDTSVGTNKVSTVDFDLAPTPAGTGYSIVEQPITYTAAATVLPIEGYNGTASVNLPFPVRHYGQAKTRAWVSSFGLITFTQPLPDHYYGSSWRIPYPDNAQYQPMDALYPFWHSWYLDDQASVRTATRGTAPNREYVVEWRNALSGDNNRVTFQAVMHESGGYSFVYSGIDNTVVERGGTATIGIQNADGSAALQYLWDRPLLRSGQGLRILPVP